MSAAAVRTDRHRGSAAPARPLHQPDAAPVRRHLRPVPDAAPTRAPRRRLRPQVALSLALVTFFLILFAVALLQTVLVQGQIHLDGLRADLAERQTEARLLHNEVAVLESPERIVDTAVNDLDMVAMDPQFVLPPPEDDLAVP